METAIAEVRPWIGLEISVAQFETTRALRTVDTRHDEPAEIELVAGEDFDFKEREPTAHSAEEKNSTSWETSIPRFLSQRLHTIPI
jgi:hypothetical protein